MSTAEKAENKPAQPAPKDRKKEELDAVIAYSGDRKFEIPMKVAEQYESNEDDDQADPDEVGGRHRVTDRHRGWVYHYDWLYGSYIWSTDGRAYRGYHWHPNANSPFAYDMDDY